ncbi:hypothetical protein ABZP36_028260 [Zizania latifolia]
MGLRPGCVRSIGSRLAQPPFSAPPFSLSLFPPHDHTRASTAAPAAPAAGLLRPPPSLQISAPRTAPPPPPVVRLSAPPGGACICLRPHASHLHRRRLFAGGR